MLLVNLTFFILSLMMLDIVADKLLQNRNHKISFLPNIAQNISCELSTREYWKEDCKVRIGIKCFKNSFLMKQD